MIENSVLRRLLPLFLIIALLMTSIHTSPTFAEGEVGVSAQAAILIDQETGRILFQKKSNDQLRIASITKIMTAIVAIENGNLKDMVKTSKNAFGVEGSSIYLKLGEKLSLEDMIYGLMLRSGNDAAVAIAEHIGGSVEGFVYLMNKKAEELGMTKTVFNNPHGLDDHEEHYSSARDMAVLTAYAMNNEVFATIAGTKRKTAPLEGEKWDRIWHNKNRMLSKYPYADGVKTGYTKRAKRTLVSSATKDGHRLIAVTLNAPDDWNDHMNMFEYGFKHYTKVTLAEKDEKLKDERLAREEGYFKMRNSFTYPLTDQEHVQKKVTLDRAFLQEELQRVPSPAGYIHFTLGGQEVGRVPLDFVLEKKEGKPFWNRVRTIFGKLLGGD
ncbi:D-alanyl-D-alanine carboxypeptidase family protein [Caldalkalibacillus mannanilyticus]|uniref:D-alanyl-D-alanine carboxypeptidase family protein n=1 Tax=Caldalkalibacillus mannanilyticus TaxID=1418 RepID=UPI00054FE28F|nr:D-alanyl-D-alanine carboxypeptidase family protein [Caldalkalibacillus mannanilyticus]